jgi:hypothetical protein
MTIGVTASMQSDRVFPARKLTLLDVYSFAMCRGLAANAGRSL